MKPISLPITLLGRIAPLASKPSREELLKEVSTPITISDLMENEKWINKALNQASEESKIAMAINEFLEENTPAILDKWSETIGNEKVTRFAKIITTDEELMEMIISLTNCFTIAGYLFAKEGEKE